MLYVSIGLFAPGVAPLSEIPWWHPVLVLGGLAGIGAVLSAAVAYVADLGARR